MPDITRRDFLKLLQGAGAVVGAGAVAAPILAYLYPTNLETYPAEPVAICKEEELPEGEAKTVPFGRYPAIIVRKGGNLLAYSAACTHFACTVKWNKDSGKLECPCHAGYFNIDDGSVISGPPPKPLLILETEVVDGTIYVKVGAL